MGHRNLAIVVVYNKKILDSSTLKTISIGGDCVSKVVIVNNGPQKIDINELDVYKINNSVLHVELIEYLENKPLSNIYNDIIYNQEEFDNYIILDDDSNLSSEYFNGISESTADVIVPSIVESSNGNKYYPLINGDTYNSTNISDEYDVYSISSGLVISKKTKSVFLESKVKLFDERFVLYGVDTSFFIRLNRIRKEKKGILNVVNSGVLYHSLSRVSESLSDFRYKERLIDELLTKKHYNIDNKWKVITYAKVFVKCLLRFRLGWMFVMLQVIIRGKHPRSLFQG